MEQKGDSLAGVSAAVRLNRSVLGHLRFTEVEENLRSVDWS